MFTCKKPLLCAKITGKINWQESEVKLIIINKVLS